jgi:hypothetical protein
MLYLSLLPIIRLFVSLISHQYFSLRTNGLSATSTFLSEQTSHQQSSNNTFLSEQISTSHQPPAKRTGFLLITQI